MGLRYSSTRTTFRSQMVTLERAARPAWIWMEIFWTAIWPHTYRTSGVTRTGPPTTRISVDGGAPSFPGGQASETTEDVETIVSLAPGTALYVYEVPAMKPRHIADAFNQVVSDNLIDTLNSSWAGCERKQPAFARSLDAIEEQGSAQGITFHSAAGDWGVHGYGCWNDLSVNVPASTPHNIGVGGTTLRRSTRRVKRRARSGGIFQAKEQRVAASRSCSTLLRIRKMCRMSSGAAATCRTSLLTRITTRAKRSTSTVRSTILLAVRRCRRRSSGLRSRQINQAPELALGLLQRDALQDVAR